jgi:hypothetical protein
MNATLGQQPVKPVPVRLHRRACTVDAGCHGITSLRCQPRTATGAKVLPTAGKCPALPDRGVHPPPSDGCGPPANTNARHGRYGHPNLYKKILVRAHRFTPVPS